MYPNVSLEESYHIYMQFIFYPQPTQKVTEENILLVMIGELQGNPQCRKNQSCRKPPKPYMTKQNNPTTKATSLQKTKPQIPPKGKHPSRYINILKTWCLSPSLTN